MKNPECMGGLLLIIRFPRQLPSGNICCREEGTGIRVCSFSDRVALLYACSGWHMQDSRFLVNDHSERWLVGIHGVYIGIRS